MFHRPGESAAGKKKKEFGGGGGRPFPIVAAVCAAQVVVGLASKLHVHKGTARKIEKLQVSSRNDDDGEGASTYDVRTEGGGGTFKSRHSKQP